MKKIFTVIIILFFVSSKAQLPSIENNQSEIKKAESIIYNLYNGKQDFLIAYTMESYWWSDKKYYEILIFRNNNWEKFSLRMMRKRNHEFSKPIISKQRINNDSFKLIDDLTTLNFWSLKSEDLNITKHHKDSVVTKYSIDDGVNYKFEILTKNEFRIIEAYEPEYFLMKMPETVDREIFIKAKKKWDENNGR
jgi:hypothetical protein